MRNIVKKNIQRIKRLDNIFIIRALRTTDCMRDKRICGQSLVKYVPSVFRDDANGVGGTGSESTYYCILIRIFSHLTLTPDDVFIDVGCGKGRVLAYLVDQNCPCPVYGVEINPVSGGVAAEWASKYDQVHVKIGDAFLQNYDLYTVLFCNRPFLPKTFLSFVELLERQLTHPVTFIYLYDNQSGYILKNRSGWTMVVREKIYKVFGCRLFLYPQHFSIWTYDPSVHK